MRNDRDCRSGLVDLAARLARRMTAVGGIFALALGIGVARPQAAFAQTVTDATYFGAVPVCGSRMCGPRS